MSKNYIKVFYFLQARGPLQKNGHFSLIYAHLVTVLNLVFLQQEKPCGNEVHGIMFNYCHAEKKAVVCNYRESVDSCKNSNFFFFYQKIPLGELFSKTIFKSFRESPVWRKIEKFKIWVNGAERRVKIMQIRAFSKRSYKTT